MDDIPSRISRYILRQRIGVGGMGTVYQARDELTGRDVALKRLHPFLADDPEFVKRFEREARIAMALDSHHVARLLDFGRDGDQRYLVMEYVAGGSLATLLRERGRLRFDEALSVATQIALALDAADREGVVHRDIKPGNVLIASDGTVKVSDFGVSRLTGTTSVTETGRLAVTVRYAAPELLEGNGDIRSDIYALGVVLYQMVTGELPFDAESWLTVSHLHQTAQPPLLEEIGRTDQHIAAIVRRCLEKRPEDRYQTPRELHQELHPEGDTTLPLAIISCRGSSLERSWRALPRSLGSKRRRFATAGAVAALAALALLFPSPVTGVRGAREVNGSSVSRTQSQTGMPSQGQTAAAANGASAGNRTSAAPISALSPQSQDAEAPFQPIGPIPVPDQAAPGAPEIVPTALVPPAGEPSTPAAGPEFTPTPNPVPTENAGGTATPMSTPTRTPAPTAAVPGWSAPIDVSNTSGVSSQPNFVVDDSGTANVLWREGGDIFYSSVEDGVPSATVNISNTGGFSACQSIAIDGSGTLHAIWMDQSVGDGDPYYSSKPPNGSWSSPLNIYPTGLFSPETYIAAERNGNLHVIWSQAMGAAGDIFYCDKPAGNSSWGGACSDLDEGNWGWPSTSTAEIAVDEGGTVHLIQRYELNEGDNLGVAYRSKPEGDSWSGLQVISNSPSSGEGPAIAVDSDGAAHAVWVDDRDGNKDIYYATNASGSWSSPVNISHTSGDSYEPRIAVDSTGTAHMVWQEDSDPAREIEYVSKPRAGSWSGPANISNTSGDSVWVWIAVDESDNVHVMWSDNTSGNYEILYKTKSQ